MTKPAPVKRRVHGKTSSGPPEKVKKQEDKRE